MVYVVLLKPFIWGIRTKSSDMFLIYLVHFSSNSLYTFLQILMLLRRGRIKGSNLEVRHFHSTSLADMLNSVLSSSTAAIYWLLLVRRNHHQLFLSTSWPQPQAASLTNLFIYLSKAIPNCPTLENTGILLLWGAGHKEQLWKPRLMGLKLHAMDRVMFNLFYNWRCFFQCFSSEMLPRMLLVG